MCSECNEARLAGVMNKSLWILGLFFLLIHLPLSVKGLHSSSASSRRLLAQETATTDAASAPSTVDCSNNGTSSSCPTPNSSATAQTSILPRSRTLTIVVVAIFVACIMMGFFSVYARRFCITDEGLVTNYQNGERVRNLQALVASLPIVHYGGAKAATEEVHMRKDMRECAVCLSEFEEGEELRVLPACDHLFHKDCIDMWLFSHTTCPLCRISLLAKSKRSSSNSPLPHVPPLAAGDQEPILSPLVATSSA